MNAVISECLDERWDLPVCLSGWTPVRMNAEIMNAVISKTIKAIGTWYADSWASCVAQVCFGRVPASLIQQSASKLVSILIEMYISYQYL